MVKIVVTIDGGIVQGVLTSEPAEVVIVDFDTEGADPDELRMVGEDEAYVYGMTAAVGHENIERSFEALASKYSENPGVQFGEQESEKSNSV